MDTCRDSSRLGVVGLTIHSSRTLIRASPIARLRLYSHPVAALMRVGLVQALGAFGANMRNLATFFALLLAVAPSVGLAQEASLADMSCREYRQKIRSTPADSAEGQTVNYVHLWLYGYASGRTAHRIMSVQDSKRFVIQLTQTCQAQPELSLVEAAEIAGTLIFKNRN